MPAPEDQGWHSKKYADQIPVFLFRICKKKAPASGPGLYAANVKNV